MDVHHDLALDEEVHVEEQGVQRGAHRPVDGVLHRHESLVHLAVGDGGEHVGDRGAEPQLGVRVVGLCEQGFLGEGASRTEVGDRSDGRLHRPGG